MSITKTHDGGYSITMIVDGVLISRKYIGYTRTEALARFFNEIAQ
jgi:hypothetical protein